jgi:E3 SUMO-protein ligase PIAS1
LRSFLVNGQPITGRTSVSVEKGAMPPTDVTNLIRVGTNLVQAVGLFPGPYIVALIVTTDSGFHVGRVPDHEETHQSGGPGSEDDDVVEGPWKISLKCPMR